MDFKDAKETPREDLENYCILGKVNHQPKKFNLKDKMADQYDTISQRAEPRF